MIRRKLPSGFGRRPLVVASLGDAGRLASDARRAVKDGADVLEVRADLFPKSALTSDRLPRLLRSLRRDARRPIVLTLRVGEEGGGLPIKFREMDRLGLFRASLAEVDGVDVELAAVEIVRHVVLEAHKRGRFVVLSAHHFKRTPTSKVLSGHVRKARRLGGDVLKVAAAAPSAKDAERLMDFCSRTTFRRKIFIPMGSWGREARLNGFRRGSHATYAHVRRPLAPGQLSVAKCKAHIESSCG